MKSISELKYKVLDPTGYEYLVVSRAEPVGSSNYQTYKIPLWVLKDFMLESDNLITEDGIDIALCDGNDTLISYD